MPEPMGAIVERLSEAQGLASAYNPEQRQFYRWLLDYSWQAQLADGWANQSQEAVTRMSLRLRQAWQEAASGRYTTPEAADRIWLLVERDVTDLLSRAAREHEDRLRDRLVRRAQDRSGAVAATYAGQVDERAPNPIAQDHARRRAGELAVGLAAEALSSVRAVVTAALAEGAHPQQVARQLARVVGLLPNQEGSVARFEAAQLQAGVKPARARAQADQLAERYRASRSLTIARTEVLAAHNAGAEGLWQAQRAVGALPPGAVKMWVVTKDCRCCGPCRALHGQTRPVGVPFTLESGREVGRPPAHPNCRCSIAMVVPSLLAGDEWAGVLSLPRCPKAPRRAKR